MWQMGIEITIIIYRITPFKGLILNDRLVYYFSASYYNNVQILCSSSYLILYGAIAIKILSVFEIIMLL